MTRGLVIAAPSSGSGKTTVTLGLARALRRMGHDVGAAKAGPDYIDPRFLAAAAGRPCVNLDAWAMSPERCRALLPKGDLVLVETAMGLYDGAPDGTGSAADLARILELPVLLVVNAAHMAQSIRALVQGFVCDPQAPKIAGLILNQVGSPRHERLLRKALGDGPPVWGALPRAAQIHHPSRHLGLVQAQERADLETMITAAADLITAHCDLSAISAAMRPARAESAPRPAPPAQRIAVAQDRAFGFTYPHMLDDWRAGGAQILPFSPLADEPPAPEADLILLPGGYPELHAPQIAAASRFAAGMRAAQVPIYGECGGYMVLGAGLICAQGQRHQMLDLLPLETSFAQRKLHLGYRHMHLPEGPFAGRWAGHEFHYATTLRADGPPMGRAQDAEGTDLGPVGLRLGKIQGSFLHIIEKDHQDD